VERIYGHGAATFQSPDLERPALRDDLFAEEVWRMLGLSPGQLVAAGAAGGAVVGGGIDAAVGGATFLAGTVIGALSGGGAALWSVGRRFARAKPLGAAGLLKTAQSTWSGGRTYRIGPHQGPAFPWVLLDRALVHYRAVARHTHARRDAVNLGECSESVVGGLPVAERTALQKLFRELRRRPNDVPRKVRDGLVEHVEALLRPLDPTPPAGEPVTRGADGRR
jgi:hypothetical protein